MKPRRPQPRLIIQGGTVVGVSRDLASLRGEELSGSLLGTWVDIANESSRSRLCWTWFHVTGSFGWRQPVRPETRNL